MMDNSQNFLKMLSDFIEAGILTSQDLKKELLIKAKKNKIYEKVLEKFIDAELIDIKIIEKNND